MQLKGFDPNNIYPTQADIDFGRAVGATGNQLIEFAINAELDRRGVPHDGRIVKVNHKRREIIIQLPAGYSI